MILRTSLKARTDQANHAIHKPAESPGSEEIRTDASNTDHFKVISRWMVFCLQFHHGFKDGAL